MKALLTSFVSGKVFDAPGIFDFSAGNAKIADWLAEQSGFEPVTPTPIVSR
jgi:hypothetical protein